MEKQNPNFIELAKAMISALEKQELDISQLAQSNADQKNVQVQLVQQLNQLSNVNERLEARITSLEKELSNVSKAYKDLQERYSKVRTEEEKVDPKRDNGREQRLEEELSRVFGKRTYVSPEALLWILNR